MYLQKIGVSLLNRSMNLDTYLHVWRITCLIFWGHILEADLTELVIFGFMLNTNVGRFLWPKIRWPEPIAYDRMLHFFIWKILNPYWHPKKFETHPVGDVQRCIGKFTSPNIRLFPQKIHIAIGSTENKPRKTQNILGWDEIGFAEKMGDNYSSGHQWTKNRKLHSMKSWLVKTGILKLACY